MSSEQPKSNFAAQTRFYIPLALQGISQSLTYPLIAAIVSAHPGNGLLQYAATAQGHIVMFVLGALGYGLVTTGMIFAKDRLGLLRFKAVNLLVLAAICLLQASVAIPSVDSFFFTTVLGLSPEMTPIARNTALMLIPAQILFTLRNVPSVLLFNAKLTGRANAATLIRLAVIFIQIPIYLHYGWTGYVAGTIAFLIALVFEWLAACWFARGLAEKLPRLITRKSTVREQFYFTLPLSLGGTLLMTSAFMVSAYISRTANPEIMLSVHALAIGILNPVSYAALRIQAVVLAFPPESPRDFRTLRFALVTGLVLALIPLTFALVPGIPQWYFGTVQHLPSEYIRLAQVALLIVACQPVIQALRAHAEGLAAFKKRPSAILAGQAMYLAVLVVALFVQSTLQIPGYRMGVTALLLAITMTLVTIRLALFWAEQEQPIEPHESNHL